MGKGLLLHGICIHGYARTRRLRMKNLYLVLFSEGKNGSLSLWQKMGWVWAMPERIGWRKYSPWKNLAQNKCQKKLWDAPDSHF